MKKKIVFAFLFAVMVVGAVKITKAHRAVLTMGETCLINPSLSDPICGPGLFCHPVIGWPSHIGVCVPEY